MIVTMRRGKYGGRLSSSNEAEAMAEELDTEIRRAKQAWLDALQAVGDDPTKQPHSESPISFDISAFGAGVKNYRSLSATE